MSPGRLNFLFCGTLGSVLLLLSACTTIPVAQRSEIRAEVMQAASDTIAELVVTSPELRQELNSSVGYLAGRMSATKLPILGGGYGLAMLHDTENGTRTFLNVRRFDLGAGLGAGRFRVLVVFGTRDALEDFRDGTWQPGIGAETAIGATGTSMLTTVGDGYTVHVVSETGAALAATARLINTSVNHDLTDTGLSEVSVPNIGFASADEQGEDAPRQWDRKLPFLAQKVIDKGYDLPLPYGIGFTYASVEQEQILTDLKVGINGNPIRQADFVDFANARSDSETLSLKADAWLFPFMNVFAMVGRVEGKAPVDVLVDGNGFLDELGIDCSSFPPNPLCPVLEDQLITLPVTANFQGTTYGFGTTLAGGWNGWFVTLPINWTYADMDRSQTDGASFTATPRVGRVINMGRNGNLALFVGGNYLETDLTVDGTAQTPGGEIVFDYIIDQENKDKWNALLGFNWDINKRLSWSAEYNGFTGSRDAFISSLSWKY